MPTEVETVCTKCGKPMPKAASMTQWIIDPTRCACTSEKTHEVSVCSLCGLPLKARTGTITHWIFKTKTCTCMHTDSAGQFFKEVKMPDDSAIAGAPYHFVSVAAHGGLGTVYKAENSKLGRAVAIKVLTTVAEEARTTQNFLREAKSSSMLQHPNLHTVLDFGTMSDGRHFLVTEWIEGLTLAQFLARHGKLSIELCQEIFSQVFDGLSHAHNRGVIHRDIKPSNIMLNRTEAGSWFVKIIDFGTAKEFSKDGATTRIEDMACSPFYMSPEQSTGAPLDHGTDLYSAGCTIYEALTGKPPFTGRPLAVVMRHQTEPPLSLTAASGLEFPESLEQFVATLLEKQPSQRFQSAEEAKASLLEVRSDDKSYQPKKEPKPDKPTDKKMPLAWLYVGLVTIGLVSVIALLLVSIERENEKLPLERAKITTHMMDSTPNPVLSNVELEYDHHQPIKAIIRSADLTKDDLKQVKSHPTIKSIDLTESTFPDSILDSIKGLELTEIYLTATNITEKSLERLLPMKHLKSLHVDSTSLHDSAIPLIVKFSELQTLDISSTRIGDLNLSKLTQLKGLNSLYIRETLVTQKGLNEISKIRSLRYLTLDGNLLSEDCIKMLAKLPRLECLAVTGLNLNPSAWPNFHLLKSVSVLDVPVTNAVNLEHFQPPPNLSGIAITYHTADEKSLALNEQMVLRKRYPELRTEVRAKYSSKANNW